MKNNYKWIICFIGLILHLCNCGLVVLAFSIFLPLIRDNLGLSNAEISLMISLRSLAALLATVLAGTYYRKLSFRTAIVLASLFVPTGLLLFSAADSA